MTNIMLDFHKTVGTVKPMHAVNNGPVYKFAADQRITNIDAFREAGIPYARNHDAAFYSTYGGEHTVDISAVFPDFDADPYDEKNYDFACTDEYLRVIDFAGAKTFYRLGSKIEHGVKKYGTLPPKDFRKWAVICEHIIRHYTEGWASGFRYDIEYWEIWNEPDLDADDSTNKRTWGGTKAQFFELYDIAATHLKTCFPHLKIGGPALAWRRDWAEDFLKQLKAPLDFFSWHAYSKTVSGIADAIRFFRDLLDRYGFKKTESILNEWNYVKGWEGDAWLDSLKAIKGLEGAAFTASVMCAGQYGPLDMLMYYDARPCRMNGMFHTDWVCENLKGYYPFRMFGELYRLGEAVAVEHAGENGIYAAAAKGSGGRAAVMLTHFDESERTAVKEVTLSFRGLSADAVFELYTLDAAHDMERTGTLTANGEKTLALPPFTVLLLTLS